MTAYPIEADKNYWAVIPKELDEEVYCQTCHALTKKPIVLLRDFTIIADSCSQECLKKYIKKEYRILPRPQNSIEAFLNNIIF
jgi:hypothetical protein